MLLPDLERELSRAAARRSHGARLGVACVAAALALLISPPAPALAATPSPAPASQVAL